jgi:hypothetical protein
MTMTCRPGSLGGIPAVIVDASGGYSLDTAGLWTRPLEITGERKF